MAHDACAVCLGDIAAHYMPRYGPSAHMDSIHTYSYSVSTAVLFLLF